MSGATRQPLVSARVLYSIKGPNGGYRLAKPAADITMLEVLEAVDGPIRGHAPTNESNSDGPLTHRLETICKQSAEQLRKQLDKVRMSDLLAKR